MKVFTIGDRIRVGPPESLPLADGMTDKTGKVIEKYGDNYTIRLDNGETIMLDARRLELVQGPKRFELVHRPPQVPNPAPAVMSTAERIFTVPIRCDVCDSTNTSLSAGAICPPANAARPITETVLLCRPCYLQVASFIAHLKDGGARQPRPERKPLETSSWCPEDPDDLLG